MWKGVSPSGFVRRVRASGRVVPGRGRRAKAPDGMKVLLLAAGLFLPALPAWSGPLVEESTFLPGKYHDLFGETTDRLDALIARPDDGKPHPLVVISHGSPRHSGDRARMAPDRMRDQVLEFARRGFTAVTFMRRGYGKSEGSFSEGNEGKCDQRQYVGPGRNSAEDVRAAIDAMRGRPGVDASRIIAVGRSAGAFASVALAADPPPGLVAVINFAGGRGSDKADSVCSPSAVVDAFAVFGKTARVPMLWVYAENDHYFGPALARRFHGAFTAAGGRAEMIMAKPFGEDGHGLFSSNGIPIWTKYVDAFLKRTGLAQRETLLPLRDDAGVRYPEGLDRYGRDDFLRYLDAGPHKAFVASQDGHYGWRVGRDTAEEALEGASERCAQRASTPCRPVMVDDRPAP